MVVVTNYRFLSIVYTCLSFVSLLFFILERRGVESVIGFWIVPAPSFLALIWTLVSWRYRVAEDTTAATKKQE